MTERTHPLAASILAFATAALIAVLLVVSNNDHTRGDASPPARTIVASPTGPTDSAATPTPKPGTAETYHQQATNSVSPAYLPFVRTVRASLADMCALGGVALHFSVEVHTDTYIRDYFWHQVITSHLGSRGWSYVQFTGAGEKSPAYACMATAP